MREGSSKGMRILYLLPYVPTPPNVGNKHLTYNLLKYISRHAQVDVAMMLEETRQGEQAEGMMRDAFPDLGEIKCFDKPDGLPLMWWQFKSLLSGRHPALDKYHSSQLADWLTRQSATGRWDVVHFDMIHMTQYIQYCQQARSVLVASDAYSLACNIPREDVPDIIAKVRLTFISWLLLRTEKMFYPRFDIVSTVSPIDAAYFETKGIKNIRVVGIPIGEEFTSLPARSFTTKGKGELPGILCTGGFATPWIAEASLRFIRNIIPRVRKQFPDISFSFLGPSPAKRLANIFAAEGDDQGLRYLDYVDNYVGFLSADWIYVYPQHCGTGLQTKVQQAMAIGLPVIGYPIAFSALGVKHGEHCFICDQEEDFAKYIALLLEDALLRVRMGSAAATYVRKNFALERIGKEMFGLY